MDVDEDDDFYDVAPAAEEQKPSASVAQPEAKVEQEDEGLEEGEEEDDMDEDGSDSVRIAVPGKTRSLTFFQDIDIITERKDGTKAPPPAYVVPKFLLAPSDSFPANLDTTRFEISPKERLVIQ